ncbi:MAG: hypothetical protein ACR2FN_02575 [Chitinophagaceae bacterium]
MKHVFKTPQLFVVAALLACAVIFSSWKIYQTNPNNSTQNNSTNGDTSEPRLQHNDAYEFDMKEFDKSMKEFDKQMENFNVELKKIDFDKINKEVKEAISKIDFNKINQDVQNSLQKIDWDKMKVDVEKSMQEAKEQVAKINTQKINEKMQALQNKLNSKEFRAQFDSAKIQQKIDEAMQKAKAGMQKAKQEMQNIKAFTDALKNDGLIDKTKPYKIELKDGELYINGTKQSKEITNKYRKYYEGKNNFTINSDGKDDENDEK